MIFKRQQLKGVKKPLIISKIFKVKDVSGSQALWELFLECLVYVAEHALETKRVIKILCGLTLKGFPYDGV